MAEGFLRSFDPALEVRSAGTSPASRVHPLAIAVMSEAHVDISSAVPKSVDVFTGQSFDYVITVCDNAREHCPVFTGKIRHRLHIGFDDPSDVQGTPEQVLTAFRTVRDAMRERLHEFYATTIAI
jgi:arsenate reductase